MGDNRRDGIHFMSKLAPQIVKLALAEVGVEEVSGSNCGPRVNEYKATTWLPADQAWPWCAAFVCWLVMRAMEDTGVRPTQTFQRPQTAGAWDMENWSLKQDASTWTLKPHKNDIQPGDIVVFTFSHIGVAVSAPMADGTIWTVEGNTDSSGSREGGGVFKKRRKLSQIRSRIRFRV